MSRIYLFSHLLSLISYHSPSNPPFIVKASTMSTRLDQFPPGVEYPPKADLRRDLYRPLPKIPPGTVDPAEMAGDVPLAQAQAVVDALNAALSSNDADELADCFYPDQAFWRDIVALTSHLRTLIQSTAIADALLHLNSLRVIEGAI